MKKRMTWKHPTGEWGLEGVDLSKLPPAVYGALYRLMKVEDMVEQINRTGAPDWLVQDILEELLGRRLEVRAEEVAKLVTRLAASEWQRAAAVEDLEKHCSGCTHQTNGEFGCDCEGPCDPTKWRGPQESGEGGG